MKNHKTTMKYLIRKSDILLEILDARFPKESRIYYLEDKIKYLKKTLILVINKADLVPEDFVEMVKQFFQDKYPAVYISCKTRKGLRVLRSIIKDYSPNKDKIFIGVFGYPNTGKSSIINALVGRHRAGVAPVPGFTRGIQLVKLSTKHYLIDSPGLVNPKDFETMMLVGAIRPEKLETPERAVKILLDKIPKRFIKNTYGIEFKDVNDFLDKLSKKLNYKQQDAQRRAAIKVLYDWIQGKIRAYWF